MDTKSFRTDKELEKFDLKLVGNKRIKIFNKTLEKYSKFV
jgi:hypothetical protein